MVEPRGQELVARYKAKFRMPADSGVTEDMILRHWTLEKGHRQQLLESTLENRSQVFERCYTELYSLEWLNRYLHAEDSLPAAQVYQKWVDILGPLPQRVYEVGPGKAEMITFLADCGYECKAAEITRERGAKWATSRPNLTWGTTDGVHLDRFEPPCSYDVVITASVIEHLHPDDVVDHLKGAFALLVPGGRYIVATGHKLIGPNDISEVFKCNQTLGMHLKEYSYGELAHAMQEAGFRDIRAVFRFPATFDRKLGRHVRARASRPYLAYLRVVEKLLGALPSQPLRRRTSHGAALVLFACNVMMVGSRPQA